MKARIEERSNAGGEQPATATMLMSAVPVRLPCTPFREAENGAWVDRGGAPPLFVPRHPSSVDE